MIEKIKIKFGTELKPTQVSWKSQLYKLDNTQGAISQNIRKMIEEITIKFGLELKPTQVSWKSQLYNSIF